MTAAVSLGAKSPVYCSSAGQRGGEVCGNRARRQRKRQAHRLRTVSGQATPASHALRRCHRCMARPTCAQRCCTKCRCINGGGCHGTRGAQQWQAAHHAAGAVAVAGGFHKHVPAIKGTAARHRSAAAMRRSSGREQHVSTACPACACRSPALGAPAGAPAVADDPVGHWSREVVANQQHGCKDERRIHGLVGMRGQGLIKTDTPNTADLEVVGGSGCRHAHHGGSC